MKRFLKALKAVNYNEAKMLEKWQEKYYAVFEKALNTVDFVSPKYNEEILKLIAKSMKKAYRRLKKGSRVYQRELLRTAREKWRAERKAEKK